MPTARFQIKGLRWWIAGVLCLSTSLNYFDRQTLALLATTLDRELGIHTREYAYITAAFLASYTVMYAVSGRLIDRLGSRIGLAIFAGGWSVASLLHSLARTAWQFAACRFALGAAEPANFPAGVKAASEWFPMRERALAVGIFNSGTALGAGIAAPLVAWITLAFGWRYSFVAGGLLGFSWVALWLFLYRRPREHPWLTPEELALIEEERGPSPVEAAASPLPLPPHGPPPPLPPPLSRLLRIRETWGCILARMVTDQLSWLFAFWIPKFLEEDRGFTLSQIGEYYWIPYLALTVGNLGGGAIPRWLIAKGWPLNRARKTVMFAASCLIPAALIAITRVANPAWDIALFSLAYFGHGCWANITLPAEVFPSRVVGAVTGLGGALGSGLGAVISLFLGRALATVSFTPVFLAFSAVPMTGFLLVLFLVPRLGQVREV